MDILNISDSKIRGKLFKLFLARPEEQYYIRQLAGLVDTSAGNIQRELKTLEKLDLFIFFKKGKMVYYKINTDSKYFRILNMLNSKSTKKDVEDEGYGWISENNAPDTDKERYCQTRDIFNARLEVLLSLMEKESGNDAYLIGSIAGEIGNNSFDHNLGKWSDIPGVYFGYDLGQRIIVLADRGQGIYATIRNIIPSVSNDLEALKIAFTKVISGRFPENRGNGLKYISKLIKEKKWKLRFISGQGLLSIEKGDMAVSRSKDDLHGCFAVLKY